ncbi:MAG: folate-binding protein YgfZ [Hyphomicrobiales bacterium]
MPACKIAELTDRSVLSMRGADAHKFLQGLVTSDVDRAKDGKAVHAALLAPQGKILFDFFVVGHGDGYLLDCPQALAADLARRLTFYKLRAKVEIADMSESHRVFALWDGEAKTPDGATIFADPRLAEMGQRLIAPPGAEASCGCDIASEADYHARRIALGVPEGGKDFAYGDTFPHEADYDQLGGVDFSKGCYVGQEVVSRMQHRGTARKRVVPVTAAAPVPAGADVLAGDFPIGKIGSTAGNAALALLRLDRAADAIAGGKPLSAGGVEITLRKPAWASFDMPGEGN